MKPLLGAVTALLLLPGAIWGGCASTKIAAREALGWPKREQLVNRVSDARDEQEKARDQFNSALAEFIAVTGASVGELEARYERLRKEHERSESRAEAVRSRIRDVERVGESLFKEWREELKEYSSDELRRASERQLDDTRAQYDRLVSAMKAAESKMGPVLEAFKDRVLFLKHNLNARAVASLQGGVAQVESDVGTLIRDMEAAIAEANAFIEQMRADAPPA